MNIRQIEQIKQMAERADRVDHRQDIMSESDDHEEKWVYDSSVDHKGKVPNRASTGVWKASLFIISKKIIVFLCFLYYL